jgi:hypothetical protein
MPGAGDQCFLLFADSIPMANCPRPEKDHPRLLSKDKLPAPQLRIEISPQHAPQESRQFKRLAS